MSSAAGLCYVKRRSPWLDLRILLQTAAVLLRGRSVIDTDATADPQVRTAAQFFAMSRKADHTKTA